MVGITRSKVIWSLSNPKTKLYQKTLVFQVSPQAAGTYPSSSQHVSSTFINPKYPKPSKLIKLAMLRTQALLYSFKSFHWRVQWSMGNMKNPTRSTKEKHIFDLVTAVPVTTQPPPPPPSRPTQPGLQPAGPKLSRTRLSAEPLNGVVAILEYQNSLGRLGRWEICWMILVSSLQLGRVGRWILDGFVGIPIGRIHGTGIFTPTFDHKKST